MKTNIKKQLLSTIGTVVLAWGGMAQAQEITPRQIHNKHQFANQSYEGDFVRMVLKFHDGSGVRSDRTGKFVVNTELQDHRKLARRNLSPSQVSRDVQAINRYLQRNELSSAAMIKSTEADFQQQIKTAEQYWGHEVAELQTYQQVLLKDGGRNPQLPIWVRTLNTYPSFELVYAEPVASPIVGDKFAQPQPAWNSCNAVPIDAAAGDLSGLQGYFGAPPVGMNATALNLEPGGQGTGIRVIDIEGGYLPHSDHKALFQIIGHTTTHYVQHGSAVIGILGALHNGIGLNGLAAEASIGFRSIFNANLFNDWASANSTSANVAYHIYWAAKHSMQGVVLIELQRPSAQDPDCVCSNNSCIATPVEYWPADFDTIQVATGNGAVIVQAAGNGGRNLDNPVFNTCGGGCFDRNNRDSGSILVSGSTSDGQTAQCFHGAPNYGSRIDMHSWSEMIPNTGNMGWHLYNGDGHCNDYREDFGGTSGASAIIAGAVTSLQGAYLAETGSRLDPLTLREALNQTGTAQIPLNVDGHDILIGPHPDLMAALQYALSL